MFDSFMNDVSISMRLIDNDYSLDNAAWSKVEVAFDNF